MSPSLHLEPAAEATPTPSSADVTMPNQMANLVERMIKEQVRLREAKETGGGAEAQSTDLSLSIWDFAGHDVYYTTHQVRVMPLCFAKEKQKSFLSFIDLRAAMLGVKVITWYALVICDHVRLAHFWQLLLREIPIDPKRGRHEIMTSYA